MRPSPFPPARRFPVLALAGLLLVPPLLLGQMGCSDNPGTYETTPRPVTGVTLSAKTLALLPGGASASLAATVSPGNASNPALTWTSSDATVATVANGVVTPVAPGTATITVTSSDGGFTATCVVTVAPYAVTGVALSSASLSLTAGGAAATLTATVSPANAGNKAVTWSSSNPAAATVQNGVVTPVGLGASTITVTTVDGGKTASCAVTVLAPVVNVTGVALDHASLSLIAGGLSSTLTATVSPANATNKTVAWTSGNAAVATVANGVVTPLSAGSATITVTTADGARTATCAVTVVVNSGPRLIAAGLIDGATDLSGLTGTLENGKPMAFLGGMGSGLAWAGGSTFLAVVDNGPNGTSYDATLDDTTSFISRFHTLNMTLVANPGAGLPYLLTPTLVNTTLLCTSDPLVYGAKAYPALTALKALNAANGVSYFTGRSDGFSTGNSGNPLDARLDPESIRVANDGQSVFIADEYGPFVYQFDRRTGKRIKSFTLPAGFYVANPDAVGANEIANNTAGRVSNKGMEGLAITPDGTTLVGFMQCALLQDGGNKASINRLVTIDIATGATHQYAYNNLVNGVANNSSELLALNNHEFLVDERDGNGYGSGNAAAVKQLYKIDIAGATDIGALAGEANLQPYAVPRTLFLDLVAVFNAAGIPSTSIPSKIEGITFGPDVLVDGVMKHTLWISDDDNFDPATQGPNQFFVVALSDADLGGSTLVPQALAAYSPTPVAVTGVSLSPASLALTVGGGAGYVTPVLAPATASNKALAWTSGNPAVATVLNGLVTPVSAGFSTLTATTADGGFKATCGVTVTIPVVNVTGVTLSPATLSLTVGGGSGALTAAVAPANASNPAVNWSSSDPTIAAVLNGVVTPIAAGSATITASTVDGGFKATCAVTVGLQVVHATGVTLDKASLTLTAGGVPAALTATVSPATANDRSLAWSTSNSAVATVAAGVVTPLAIGSATITATTHDGGFTATCAVTVTATHRFYGFTGTGQVFTKTGATGAWVSTANNPAASPLAFVISNDANTFYGFTTSPVNGNIYQMTGAAGSWSLVGTAACSGTMKAAVLDGTSFYGFTATGKFNSKTGVAGAWGGSNLGGTSGLAFVQILYDGSTFTGFQADGSAYTNTLANVVTASTWLPAGSATTSAVLVSVVSDGSTFYGISADGQMFARTGTSGTWSNVSTATAATALVSIVYN